MPAPLRSRTQSGWRAAPCRRVAAQFRVIRGRLNLTSEQGRIGDPNGQLTLTFGNQPTCTFRSYYSRTFVIHELEGFRLYTRCAVTYTGTGLRSCDRRYIGEVVSAASDYTR